MAYSTRIDDAFAFAHRVHRDQRRKGSGAPFITHVMSVAALVGEHGGDEEQLIAALLHDAVEDGEGRETLGEIRAAFGGRVADLVEGCTDAFVRPKPPWLERKENFIEAIKGAPPDLRLIVAADKIHNVRTIARDLQEEGACVWDRFQGKRDGSLWYYTRILEVLSNGWQHPILDELRRVVEQLRAVDESVCPSD
ncbi:MAG: HD domain-containing protein [Candidatus Hydrogenedentes bacterium]|nr:HD domain-containing protein [Candidatus Hydrogenedentota bacterium]